MKKDFDFYFTWCKQDEAHYFEIKKASGCHVTLKNNQKVYDLSSTSFQSSFGFNHPIIVKEIKKQLDLFTQCSPKVTYPLKEKVTKELLKLLKVKNGKIFYTLSGSESIENALKIVRQISQKKIVCARTRSYHGASLGALSITGDWRNPEHFTVSDWTLRIPEPYEDLDASKTRKLIEDVGVDKVAAICVETITGANGVIIPPQSWWDGIQKICDDYKIYLICDEVLCGFYRTGPAFGFQDFKVRPNIVTMSKAISGGHIPFGAIWTDQAISDYYKDKTFACGLTHYAHPLGIASLAGVLKIVNDAKFKKNLKALEKVLTKNLAQTIKIDNVKEIRVKGMLVCIDLFKPVKNMWDYFLKNNQYIVNRDTSIVLAPILISKPNELDKELKKFNKLLGLVK